jgi:hypothetical protein
MAGKVTDISNTTVSDYVQLSQTPSNYNKKNYFIKELQDKITEDWAYRPNRVDVEYENVWGAGTYTPLEVVVQTVKSDTGTALSDDYRRLVFKNIRNSLFNTGNKFRFSPEYDLSADESAKDVWLVMNRDTVSLTSSVVAVRCNNTLATLEVDAQGIGVPHYEPAIFGLDMRYVNNQYNQTAVENQSNVTAYVQYNDITKNYYLNERFILGTGIPDVFRIKGMSRFYSHSTFNASSVGIIQLYFEHVDASAKDNFTTRIAYQNVNVPQKTDTPSTGGYVIKFDQPTFIPADLTPDTLSFVATLYNGTQTTSVAVVPSISLPNLPSGQTAADYATLVVTGDNSFTLVRTDAYYGGALTLTVTVPAASSPTGEEISTSISFGMTVIVA